MKSLLTEKYFRMLILGCSQCGKTYLVANSIIPAIKKNYSNFIVFTRSYNKDVYKKIFDRNNIPEDKQAIMTLDPTFIMLAISKLKATQEKYYEKNDKDGHPIYKSSILVIFDDILNENMMKSDAFLEIFANLRHLQISTILLSQITNKAITTQMKANTNYTFMFKLMGHAQQLYPIQLIEDCILKREPFIKKDNLNNKARKIYSDNVMSKKYGYIFVDSDMNMRIPAITTK